MQREEMDYLGVKDYEKPDAAALLIHWVGLLSLTSEVSSGCRPTHPSSDASKRSALRDTAHAMHYTCIHCIGFRSSSTFFFSLTRRLLLVITRHDRKRPQKEETSSNARACRRKPQDRSLRRALKVSLRAGLRLSWSGLVWPGLSKVSTQRELSSFSSKPAVLYLVLTRLSSHVALQHRHHSHNRRQEALGDEINFLLGTLALLPPSTFLPTPN